MSRRFALALALGLSVGCATGPLNGTATGDPVVGKSFLFQGYTDHPDELVVLEVLKTPSLDPAVDASWALFNFAHTTTSPTFVNGHTDPIYYWSVNAMPVASAGQAARWPTGGLARIRARRLDAGNGNQSFQLVTFDESTFSDCFTQHFSAGEDWTTIGDSCAGIGGKTIAIASYATSPATLPAADKPDWLGRKHDISQAETQAYYNTWGAPLTLGLFQAQYGFANGDVHATYYNDGDLGLGREMHCRQFSAAQGFGLACYVINYTGTAGVAVFDGNTGAALNDAIHHPENAFATVAMVYTPPASVNFVVYRADGFQQRFAQLDSPGIHTSIPNNCLTCHGIEARYDAPTHSIKGPAKFLPFDPFAFKFSSESGFTLPDQQNAFRRLNAFVKVSNPSPAIAELIDGLYEPKSVNDITAVATDNFIPDAWEFANSSQSGSSTYKGIIKRGCRTCHISAVSDTLDFNDPDDWSAQFPLIRPDVCAKTNSTNRGHSMPQAERVSKKFWASGGRAYLITGYPVSPPDGLEGCDP